jgi:hypothetical protein
MEFSEIDSCAAIELAGEFGFGSLSNDWIEVKMAETSYVGLHLKKSIIIKYFYKQFHYCIF